MEAVMGLENIQNQLRKNCLFSSFATDNCSCWLVLVFFSHLEAFYLGKISNYVGSCKHEERKKK